MKYMLEMARRHGGRVFRHWFGPVRPSVVFHHPDTLKLILKTAEPKGTGGNGPYAQIYPWLGKNLLSSSNSSSDDLYGA